MNAATDAKVREAEAIVHRAWQAQLSERRQEMEAALGRATARCDAAQRSLTAAQRSGDPRQIADSRTDLAKALEAAARTALAWDRIRQVLGLGADLPVPTTAPDSAATPVISSGGANLPADSDQDRGRDRGREGTMVSTTIETWRPRWDAALRRPVRFPAAALLLATAGIHVPITGVHLNEAPYIGTLFIVLALVSTALAGLLLVRDSMAVWLAAAGVATSAALAYALSRTVGLPQIGDDVGNWLDPLGMAALSAEILTVAAAVWALRNRDRVGRRV